MPEMDQCDSVGRTKLPRFIPGDEVQIGPKRQSATVCAVLVERAEAYQYRVGTWNKDHEYKEVWLPEEEIFDPA